MIVSAIDCLAASIYQATLQHLKPYEIDEIRWERTPGKPGSVPVNTGKKVSKRPTESECNITMFTQVWGSTALGFGGVGGQAITSAYTVVIGGPCGDFCVYFAGRFAYRIERPNARFLNDISICSLQSVGRHHLYERDADAPAAD